MKEQEDLKIKAE